MAEHAEQPAASVSDYERVGGGRAVAQVVDRFYQLVLADPQLAPFFVNVDISRLKRHQVLLVSQVLGGPADYDGRELREAHEHLRIRDEEFSRVVMHLVVALREAGVDADVIARVDAAVGGARADIVSVPVG